MKESLIAYSVQSIFQFIEQDDSHDFVMRISCFEVYKEGIYDLLAIHSDIKKLKVKSENDVMEEVCSTILEITALWNLCLSNKNNLNAMRK